MTFQDTEIYIFSQEKTDSSQTCGCLGLNEDSVSSAVYELESTKNFPTSNRNMTSSDIPAYFSWRDVNGEDWTTPVTDQGNCGSCWLCAAFGALETIIKIGEGNANIRVDLSEQYVLSCLPRAGSCNGGWAYRAFRYIKSNTSAGNNCNGIIPEFCFPYQVTDDVPCSAKCDEWEDFLIPISDCGYWNSGGSLEDINAIKTQVLETGPVVAAMMATYYPHGESNFEEWGWEHHDPTDYYPYPGPFDGTNHQVVIIGWKDDSSIGNGGYWIVKNSFSDEWGYDGFFNIEYGSLNIDSSFIDWVEYNADNFSNWKPVAEANGRYVGSLDEEIEFDGSKSFDHEGELITYHWDFGDGKNASSEVVGHSYSQPGIYPVTLKIVDNEGYQGFDTTWAFIDTVNHPPDTPVLSGPKRGKNSTSYKYSFSSQDVDGDDIYYYLVWGDTYWEGWWEGWIGPYASGETVTLENSWGEDGKYTIRVKAKDIYDAKSDWATQKIHMHKNTNINPLLLLFGERCHYLLPFLRDFLWIS